MKFKKSLQSGTFIKRYKRFFADIKVGEDTVVAHCANTGTMKTCLQEGWPALISFHDSPTRKLKYSFEMINNGVTWIGINTSLTNSLAIEGIKTGVIKELQGYKALKPEAKIGKSRIDIFLSNSEEENQHELCYVEVKNVTFVDDENHALFPDAVTERGLKHLNELLELKRQGIRTVMLFVVQREDCDSFKIEQEIDVDYCNKLKEAMKGGVEILAYQCKLSPEEIIIHKKLSIV